jgi:hypothetical protein
LLPGGRVKPSGSEEACAKVIDLWKGNDPNVISVKRSKARVRRDWPTLAQALDDLEKSANE